MIKGLYTVAAGMNLQSQKMDVISNNLANVNTTGYKKDRAITSSFSEVLITRLNDMQNHVPNNGTIGTMSLGAKIDEIYTEFSQGSVVSTGEAVDVAIQGSGFFVVQTPAGEAYTRDGNFIINSDGGIVTTEGYAVMGQDGPLQLGEDFLSTSGNIVINDRGELYVNSEFIDVIDIANFENTRELTKLGDNLFQSTGNRIDFEGSLLQGYVETSNVNPVTAMVDMITVSRAYEANQKMLQTQDSLLDKAVNEVGRA